MRSIELPPVRYLRSCFSYDPKTGVLRWKHRPRKHFTTTKEWKRFNTRYAEGIISTGRGFKLNKRVRIACRICWKIATSKEPPPSIDHENGNRHDNRLINLRDASDNQQQWNKGIQRNNTSGYKGVSRSGLRYTLRPWRALIKIGGINRHLGHFATAEEASKAYKIAARKLHGKFYRDT